MSRSTSPPLAGLKIRVHRPSATSLDHPLEEGRSVFIGHGDSCGIQIKGEGVAAIHCLVDVNDQIVSIQDWASDAGTRVNGQAIDDKTALSCGDEVLLGSMRLELVGGTPPELATDTADESREDSSTAGEALTKIAPVGRKPANEKVSYDLANGRLTATAISPTHNDQPQPDVSHHSQNSGGDEVIDQLAEEPQTQVSAENDDGFQDSQDDSSATPVQESVQDSAQDPDYESLIEEESLAADEASVDEVPNETIEPAESDAFESGTLSAEDFNWNASEIDDEEVDAEIVQLLKSEIEDLRIQLAERDEQLAAMEAIDAVDSVDDVAETTAGDDFGSSDLVGRVDDLLSELAEHDERVETLQELLQSAEVQNQAEREERNCLENWVGEIEQRIGERESEWQAEQDALRTRLESACEERDQVQQQLHSAAQRYGTPDGAAKEIIPDETLGKLQQQNSDLQSALEESQKQCASLTRQIERLKTEEPESLQLERAEVAKQKAEVSRLRFQLTKQLEEIGKVPDPKDQPDREFAYKLQTLREHLREIHEEEKVHRDSKGDGLFGRISNLWKRVDDEY